MSNMDATPFVKKMKIFPKKGLEKLLPLTNLTLNRSINQPCTALTREEHKAPLKHDGELVAKTNQISDVNKTPHEPAIKPDSCIFQMRATAFAFPIVAKLPLSKYRKGGLLLAGYPF